MRGRLFTRIGGIKVDVNGDIGETVGRLTTIGVRFMFDGGSAVVCECSCGSITVIKINALRPGRTTSCGCWNKEQPSLRFRIHGVSGTPEYYAWCKLISRCTNQQDANYHNYGARGIRVCDRWLESVTNFLEDMGPRPDGHYSLDRIDNNGDYEPNNCRWATGVEQSNNRRTNVMLSVRGVEKSASEWAREVDLPVSTIYQRLSRGMDVESAVFTPWCKRSDRRKMQQIRNRIR